MMYDYQTALTALESSVLTVAAGIPIVKSIVKKAKAEVPKAEHVAEAVFSKIKGFVEVAKPIAQAVETLKPIVQNAPALESALQRSELSRVAGTVLQALGKGYSDLNQFEQVALVSFVQAQVPGATAADVTAAVKDVESLVKSIAQEPVFQNAQTFAKTLAELSTTKIPAPATDQAPEPQN